LVVVVLPYQVDLWVVDDDDSTVGRASQRLWSTAGPAVVVVDVRRDDDSRPWSVVDRPEALVVVGGNCTSELGCHGDAADAVGDGVMEEDTWGRRPLAAVGDDRTAYWDATDERPWSYYSDVDDRHAFRGTVAGEIAWVEGADHDGTADAKDDAAADVAAAGRPSSS
jgi:hypothetical protein